MDAHLGLRPHELLYKEIGNIIDEILSACKKVECYEEVANHSQRILRREVTFLKIHDLFIGVYIQPYLWCS